MRSCLYRGWVRHRRFTPRRHAFRYGLFMVYLDLQELDTVFRGRWLWSTARPALAWFRRADYPGDTQQPLHEWVRDLVAERTGRRPGGPIGLLTHLRYLGYGFNPISIYYCFDASGERVETMVAEVTSTPWGERCHYVLSPRPGERFAKEMHVSPFLPMDLHYRWYASEPGERLHVHLNVCRETVQREEERQLDATLNLRRRPINTASLAGALIGFPWMSVKVIAAIHWEALRLWLKGVPVFHKPSISRKTI